MRKRKYTVEVVFSYSEVVEVLAEDPADAMEKAEDAASEIFVDDFNSGLINSKDFYCEAQQP